MNATRTSTVRQLPAYEMELVDVSDVRSPEREKRGNPQAATPAVFKLLNMHRTPSPVARSQSVQTVLRVRTMRSEDMEISVPGLMRC